MAGLLIQPQPSGNIQGLNRQGQNTPLSGVSPAGQDNSWLAQIGPAYKLELSEAAKNSWADPEVRRLKQVGQIECQTCKNRTYQDGSDDPGVSFKSPTHIAPENAAAAVSSHEQEHVVREQSSAQAEGRKVISQSVQIYTSVCPECGRSYVSGGQTKTTTAADAKPPDPNEKLGGQVDMMV